MKNLNFVPANYKSEYTPLGGNSLAHGCTHILLLRPSGYNRTAKIVKSPAYPYMDAKFTLDEKGIDDPEEIGMINETARVW